MMNQYQRIGTNDPRLYARVVEIRQLFYDGGADSALDRPAFVRAGSSLARFGHTLAVIQDDANFVALIDLQRHTVRALDLPAGADGLRQFDDRRGNKRFKLDLEACVAIRDNAGDLLLTFGSGSSPLRESVAVIRDPTGSAPDVALVEARELYALLRSTTAFAGSDMNIEGAVMVDNRIRLFGRGNGVARAGLLPLDATCDLDWPALWAYLQRPRTVPPPQPQAVVQYQLGALDGLRLGFTDAAHSPAGVIFSASAEDSPDATQDGPVAGSAIGMFSADGAARWTVIRDRTGERFAGKVEGLVLAPETPYRGYLIVDRDDPECPSELCEVELTGPWYIAG